MTQAKSLKYPNATQERVCVSSKSSVVKCINKICGKFAQEELENSSKRTKRQQSKFGKSCFCTLYKRM